MGSSNTRLQLWYTKYKIFSSKLTPSQAENSYTQLNPETARNRDDDYNGRSISEGRQESPKK